MSTSCDPEERSDDSTCTGGVSSSTCNASPRHNTTSVSSDLESDLAKLFAAVDSVPDPSSVRKKRITHLPGFLFHDGKEKAVYEGQDAEDKMSGVSTASKNSGVASEFGTSAEECVRLTSKVFTNSFEVLRLAAHATEEEAKRAFRKISLLIHPDKCRHPAAQQAFLSKQSIRLCTDALGDIC